MAMKEIWYDEEEDILGIRVKDGEYWKSVELPSGVVIDLDKGGQVMGLEIWNASKVFSGDAKRVIDGAKLKGSE
jgi:uncharacterized protein YuzE